MRLIIAGGGTGGHLFPGIAVAEEFLARDSTNEVLFVGTERGIEARVLPRLGYRLEMISAAGVRGKNGIAQMVGLAKFMHGYSQSRQLLKSYHPDLVLGVGGYASAPMVLAARGMQVRRFVHEQNAIPGMTNKILARVAEKVFISLEEARKFFPAENTILTGNPLRRQILDEVATERPATSEDRFNLLVFGGSQGARSINRALVAALPHLESLRDRLAITHQTGENDLAEVQEGYEKVGFPAEVVAFIDNMSAAYHRADLIICRAGATTIAEVTACGKPCLFIPFPHATDDHQRRNSEALLKEGACFMMLEHELTGERLAQEIIGLVGDSEQLAETGRNARRLARLDAAKVIVDEMLKNGR